jgi:hypothetical protein
MTHRAQVCMQVHGQVLAGWSLNQLGQAAQQAAAHGSAGEASAAAATLQRLDTFLAANWQAYVEFAEAMVQQVRCALGAVDVHSCGLCLRMDRGYLSILPTQ